MSIGDKQIILQSVMDLHYGEWDVKGEPFSKGSHLVSLNSETFGQTKAPTIRKMEANRTRTSTHDLALRNVDDDYKDRIYNIQFLW